MSEEQPSELLAARRRKLEALRDAGVEPFPHAYPGVSAIAEVKAPYEALPAGDETEDRVRIAGRLHARRGQGKAAFLDLDDRSGRMQLHARVDVLGPESLEALLGLDLGDLIGVDGSVFRTRRGELSLKVEDWELLAKSLRPPPEKHHGLTDVETRFRHRELDLIANEEARETFMTRAKVITAIRAWLDERGFIEVETPVLQPIYGGGAALPFTTHFNALDRDFYLRIAVELYLKRLIVGGLERVYEIGKNFRNEGLSYKHNPEFTMLEWYEAYADYEDVARHAEELVHFVATQVGQDRFKPPWARETLGEAIASGPASTSTPTARSRGCRPRCASTTSRCPTRTRGRSSSTTCSPSTSSRTCRRRPSSSTIRSSCRRSRSATAARRGWSSAGRPTSTGWRSPTRSQSSTIRTTSAPVSRRSAPPRRPATRRRIRSTRPTSRRSSTACRRPVASASGSTGS